MSDITDERIKELFERLIGGRGYIGMSASENHELYNGLDGYLNKLQSRISAMQEVCEKARGAIDPKMIKIHGGKCICAHCELIRAIDKLNEVIA